MIDDGNVWFLGFINIGSFYLLLLIVVFLFFWLFVKPWFSLINIITILCCGQAILEFFPLNANSHFNMEKSDASLRVMSWNVMHFNIQEHKKHPEKKAAMIKIINDFNPDIACFQEMVASDDNPNSINYVPDFVEKMKMRDYHYAYIKKLDFDKKHHFGIITFSKYPIIRKATICLNPNNYNSVFQYCDIKVNRDTIRVFNVHLQSLKFSPDNRSYIEDPSLNNEKDLDESKNILYKFKKEYLKRREQADAVRRAINQSPYPVMVCGDFNDVPNSYPYRTIGKNLNNTFSTCGFGLEATFSSIAPTLRIDHIFTDRRFDILQFKRLKKKLSDHYPIVTDIRLKK
jgi:endonuclease/exonuclease/phosphatase family metal-dependent hydrolase